jgi:hypothetical protein
MLGDLSAEVGGEDIFSQSGIRVYMKLMMIMGLG